MATGLLALAGCDSGSPSSDEANMVVDVPEATPPVSAPEVLPSPTPETAAPETDKPAPPSDPAPAKPTRANPTPAETTPGPMPLAYRGIWAMEAKDCKAQPGMTRIAVAPGAIRYYEGRSQVQKVTGQGRHLVIDVAHEAEGYTEQVRQTLDLSADGATLTFSRAGQRFNYRKC